MKNLFLLLLLTIFLQGNTKAQTNTNPLYEMRGVWIATVNNTDWPSARGLTVQQQKDEFINILNLHQQNGINAIFMQIRPSADAFFPSQYEPWSIFLNGTQGLPPVPYYDPLAFMIEEAHKRNMEFHAWLNPYRAVFKIKDNPVSPSHITKLKPEWFVTYGDNKYFNPGLPEVRQHILRVVRDMIERYDIDGIHMDDYFYPYRITGKEFPDEVSYKKYGNGLSKDDWRRSNCDSIIKNLWETINSQPHRVKFGISPFGVWRNADKDPLGSATKAGQTNYDDLYADIMLWLKNGWMDYCVPQLYWEINHPLCDYNTLLEWWNKNSYGRHLYIGQAPYRAGGKGWQHADELTNQIKKLREYKTTQGSIFFSSKSFDRNPLGWNDSLRNNYYKTPALPPVMPWIKSDIPVAPTVSHNANSNLYNVTISNAAKSIAVFEGVNAQTATLVKIVATNNYSVNKSSGTKTFVATVSKENLISDLVEVK